MSNRVIPCPTCKRPLEMDFENRQYLCTPCGNVINGNYTGCDMAVDPTKVLVFEERVEPLFVIEVMNLYKPPVVKYKGEAIVRNRAVSFEYNTGDVSNRGELSFSFEHVDGTENGEPSLKVIAESRI